MKQEGKKIKWKRFDLDLSKAHGAEELQKEFDAAEGWQSPVAILTDQLCEQYEKAVEDRIMCEIRGDLRVDVDKDELMRALEYDRNQYEEGYRNGRLKGYCDGYNDAIEKVKQVMERWIRGDES